MFSELSKFSDMWYKYKCDEKQTYSEKVACIDDINAQLSKFEFQVLDGKKKLREHPDFSIHRIPYCTAIGDVRYQYFFNNLVYR
jgi:hypothetical protein